MRGLEERLRLALEGTETGFWEWHVETDVIEWSDNMGPMYGLPRGTQPGGYGDFLDRILHPDDRDEMRKRVGGRARARDAVRDRRARRAPRQGPALAARPGRAVVTDGRTERITGLLSDVTDRRAREDAREFLDAASQVLASSLDPVEMLEQVARLAVPGWPTGARSSSPTSARSRSPTSIPRRSAGRGSCRSATRPTPTRRPARPP